MSSESLLKYYQDYRINPVPINLEDQTAFALHYEKRANLYKGHLDIPLSFFNERSVLECGCNSGENALILAFLGANLTLVEPNNQVIPRLLKQFRKYDLEHRISSVEQTDIDSFQTEKLFDIAIAEGFLFSLPNREELIHKLASFLKPHGLAVVSFNDRYGCLLEFTRKMLLWRVCQLSHIEDIHCETSLELARKLYLDDFMRINSSRPFDIWWADMLINPIFSSRYCWSFGEIIPVLEAAGCVFYSSSPKWTTIDHFTWYKNVSETSGRHHKLIYEHFAMLPYFLTGLMKVNVREPANVQVAESVRALGEQISKFTGNLSSKIEEVTYPAILYDYLGGCEDVRLRCFNSEMKTLFDSVASTKIEDMISSYHRTEYVRNLWGVPYQYICFTKDA